jgi:hypothetical protein
VATIYKLQQFHQNYFNSPDDDRIDRKSIVEKRANKGEQLRILKIKN